MTGQKFASKTALLSQSAFVRGFIDDERALPNGQTLVVSQSAFVRGFIDDAWARTTVRASCAVSIRVRARLHR